MAVKKVPQAVLILRKQRKRLFSIAKTVNDRVYKATGRITRALKSPYYEQTLKSPDELRMWSYLFGERVVDLRKLDSVPRGFSSASYYDIHALQNLRQSVTGRNVPQIERLRFTRSVYHNPFVQTWVRDDYTMALLETGKIVKDLGEEYLAWEAFEHGLGKEIFANYVRGLNGESCQLDGGSWQPLASTTILKKRRINLRNYGVMPASMLYGPETPLFGTGHTYITLLSRMHEERGTFIPKPRGGRFRTIFHFRGIEYMFYHEMADTIGIQHFPQRDFIRAAYRNYIQQMLAFFQSLNRVDTKTKSVPTGTVMKGVPITPLAMERGVSPRFSGTASQFAAKRKVKMGIFPKYTFRAMFWALTLLPPSSLYKYVGMFFNLWKILDGEFETEASVMAYGRAYALGRGGISPKVVRRGMRAKIYGG